MRRPEWLAERGGKAELLRVPAALFSAASGLRARLYDRGLLPTAKLDVPVVSVTGDGGFMFGMPELASAAQQDIGLITIVFNNNSFGNVRRDQQEKYDNHIIGADLDNPDFVKLAESFGVAGYRAASPDDLKPVLTKAIDDDKPAIIEVPIEKGTETSPWKYILR